MADINRHHKIFLSIFLFSIAIVGYLFSGGSWAVEDFDYSYRSTAEEPQMIFEAKLHDNVVTDNSPGIIEFSLRNEGNTVNATTPGFYPFGVPYADHMESDRSFFLWNEDYSNENNYVNARKDGIGIQAIGLNKKIAEGREFTVNYSIITGKSVFEERIPIQPGSYQIEGDIDYRKENYTQEEFKYQLDFTLERQNRLSRAIDKLVK